MFQGRTAGSDPVFEAFWDSLTSSRQGVDGDDAIVAPNGALVVRGSPDPTATRADALRRYDRLSVPDGEAIYTETDGGTHFLHRAVDSFQSGIVAADR